MGQGPCAHILDALLGGSLLKTRHLTCHPAPTNPARFCGQIPGAAAACKHCCRTGSGACQTARRFITFPSAQRPPTTSEVALLSLPTLPQAVPFHQAPGLSTAFQQTFLPRIKPAWHAQLGGLKALQSLARQAGRFEALTCACAIKGRRLLPAGVYVSHVS